MTIDMSQFYEVFFDESEELLAEAERLLLNVNVSNPDNEELNAIFRAAHSIKGGAATFGFMDMTEITHVLENLLDKIRKNEMALTVEHVDAFLSAKDVLKMELDGHRNQSEVDQTQVADVKLKLKMLSEASGVVIKNPPAPPAKAEPEEGKNSIAAVENVAPELSGVNKFLIKLPKITEKDAANIKSELTMLGDVVLNDFGDGVYELTLISDSSHSDIISICSFIVDVDDIKISLADPVGITALVTEDPEIIMATPETDDEYKPKFKKDFEVHEEAGYGLFDVGGGNSKEEGYGFFAPFNPHKDAVKSTLLHDATTVTDDVKSQITEAVRTVTPIADKKAPVKTEETSSIRVGIEKVDQLINLVGELVITQAMIEQRVSQLDPAKNEALMNSVGQLTRNTRDLQESVMSIRMMPMDFVFSRFPRMVRDLAGKLGKKVDFVTKGASTELDKGLIERIVDPLTHLVRNSVDHGIETPENRKKSGKKETGTLTLGASHKGGSIVIEVTDDGAGLNRDKLLAKARSSGLVVSDSMTDTEVFGLIFAPGFSTAEVVTDVSGRGVGMDVVKRNISSMGGTVEIRSVLGYGTTISIALPLTLAILDGMSVSLGDSLYIIPLNLIIETLQPMASDLKTVAGRGPMVHVRGEYLPIIPLYKIFSHETEITNPTNGVLVLLEAEGKRSALLVDGLVGQQQVVIKSLETNYKKTQGVSGATIMGDGSVALILDVPGVIQMGQYY